MIVDYLTADSQILDISAVLTKSSYPTAGDDLDINLCSQQLIFAFNPLAGTPLYDDDKTEMFHYMGREIIKNVHLSIYCVEVSYCKRGPYIQTIFRKKLHLFAFVH